MTTPTIYWHDYEAGGVNPRADRPMQFAGIRTDQELNIIGKPLKMYCQLSPDYLPHPEACLITGITPQAANQRGLPECEFARRIHHEFSQPATTIVGYNNIRYDDEMSRFLFYRNFIDPYAYSWENENSRWDLLTLVRATYALRPEGIEWPVNDEGQVSLKLDKLAPANGIEHSDAHDAMADVYASIALAKKILHTQPKLYAYSFNIRQKKKLIDLVESALVNQAMLVHVSGFYGAESRYVSWVYPLAFHPENKNQLIAWRLDRDPEMWRSLSPAEIRENLYANRDDLKGERPGLITITLNQCPFLAPAKTLAGPQAEHAGIDVLAITNNRTRLAEDSELRDHLIGAFLTSDEVMHGENHGNTASEQDPDLALYSGGFFSTQAKTHMTMIKQASPEQLAALDLPFDDPRLPSLLFRYRARNFPQTLSANEQQRWKQHCQSRLVHGGDGFLSSDEFVLKLEQLAELHQQDPKRMAILKSLADYLMAI
ncbi:exodeoxyribonuclease I [Aliidiomarina iranensis]|uniref:Exodeoxyribonuclease I n=1 Tax=Aliidiomarina iranensis TaxID=1434071 RepID=A0A432VZZ3_9GAMM|nr:exodeoxyribonuclease I [Aliidiomarina iranensis]RUO22316.1 exodeoxyribonuclease I [Aliidiomarina iranensis]